MLKKTIKFTDVFDVERTEDFYFNLNKAEITELELTTKGGYGAYLQGVGNARQSKEVFEALKQIIKTSYGVRTEQGNFVKRQSDWEEFEGSGAYEQLIVEFFESSTAAAEFANGILPKDLRDAAEERRATAPQNGFRPGADILPQSRREALAQEQTGQGPAVQPYDPSQPGTDSAPSAPPLQSFNEQDPEAYRQQ